MVPVLGNSFLSNSSPFQMSAYRFARYFLPEEKVARQADEDGAEGPKVGEIDTPRPVNVELELVREGGDEGNYTE